MSLSGTPFTQQVSAGLGVLRELRLAFMELWRFQLYIVIDLGPVVRRMRRAVAR